MLGTTLTMPHAPHAHPASASPFGDRHSHADLSPGPTHRAAAHLSAAHAPALLPIFLVHPGIADRRRLAAVLETLSVPVREFSSGAELLGAVDVNTLGCLVCDADLGGSSGLHLLAQLQSAGIVLPTVLLIPPGDVHGAVAALKAGVGEIIVKPIDTAELLHAVRSVTDAARGGGSRREAASALLRRRSRLSDREVSVFRLITRGLSNKEAAADLGLAVKTIEIHRANAMKKMECQSFAQLVRAAVALEAILPR
ncbi:hypothetical protein BH11PLA1_BH11PLA1_12080 [soil metagenome]